MRAPDNARHKPVAQRLLEPGPRARSQEAVRRARFDQADDEGNHEDEGQQATEEPARRPVQTPPRARAR